ncbi:hypothetical protein WJX81_002670 [Elliptochloris bilobata]|uniref:Tyrosine-protein phosphatase domain-containing protein n=1 Tax=Elliptochloris bilobata TaxID=381761 RepID=A0AAW1S3J5_9CHLO
MAEHASPSCDAQTASNTRTELQARREKLAHFDKQCSRVTAGLYVGSDTVARSRDALRGAGITHVVNCVGALYPAYFSDELRYLVLHLQDTPVEDILAVAFDVFDFIEDAQSQGGRVLSFEDAFAVVKAARGVANPNIGFVCQLLNWQKRRAGKPTADAPRVFRLAPQSAAAPTYLVAKAVLAPSLASLDPRGAFVVHLTDAVYVWRGSRCLPAFAAAAERAAAALSCYEGAPAPPALAAEGKEPAALLSALRGPADADAPRAAQAECDAYSRDYQLFAEAVTNATATPGRVAKPKTPRCEASAAASEGGSRSPNERVRKTRRSGPAFGASPGRSKCDYGSQTPR